MRRIASFLCAATCALVPFAVQPAAAIAPVTPTPSVVRASVANDGAQGTSYSQRPAISATGRFVAFDSLAANLVTGDTNGVHDIFVRDLEQGTTVRVSVDSTGTEGNGDSYLPAISADGRYVVFKSSASNLVPNDTNNTADIFVHDLETGTTTRVSVDSAGRQGNSGSYEAVISADGQRIAFHSFANNLVAGDTNGTWDVFVHDLQTGTTIRASVDSAGRQANRWSQQAAISADGRFVAFHSTALNLDPADTNTVEDVYVRDLEGGTTTRVSVPEGNGATNAASYYPALSADGRYISFHSFASNLVAGDTNGVLDVFVRDMLSGTTERMSVDANGKEGNKESQRSAISADGRFIAFFSDASNLVAGDTGGNRDVFVVERATGVVERVSTNAQGVGGNAYSYNPSLSADGRFIAYHSFASNLVAGDTNATWDVFVRSFFTIAADAAATVPEGTRWTVPGSFTDPGGRAWTATVDYDDGAGAQPLVLDGKQFVLDHTWTDDGEHAVAVTISAADGATTTRVFAVTVENVAPVVKPIAAAASVAVNRPFQAQALFADAGTDDTHTAVWDWGDGTTSNGTVAENGGRGSASGTHTYTTPGIYTVGVVVTDDDGGAATVVTRQVVVFKADASKGSGGVFTKSPAGAYVAEPGKSGQAYLYWDARFKPGTTTIQAQARFDLKFTPFAFRSTSNDWVLFEGGWVRYQGSGTVNGTGDYGFLVSAVDGNVAGGDNIDRARIIIWDKATGTVVYDNEAGRDALARAMTPIYSGSQTITTEGSNVAQ